MKTWNGMWAGVAVATLAMGPATSAWSQVTTAKVHGKVINPAGLPQAGATVEMSTDKSDPKTVKFTLTTTTDANGVYSLGDAKPGEYEVYVVQEGKFVDRLELKLKAGDDSTLDFDMTRAEYVKDMTEEQKAAIAKYKESLKTNGVIANLNATLAAVRADIKTPTPNFDKDIADMTQATTQKPEEGILWGTLGDTLVASADHQSADDRKAGKSPMSDETVVANYGKAIDAYKKAIDLNSASKKPSPADQATMLNQEGLAYAHLGKITEAQAAYEQAGKLVPANAGMYYGNEAAILYNASQQNAALGDAAVEAANKAIAAEPTRADAYYIKGQILLQKATLDPKTQKIVAPPGCVEAYQKYLELAPDGKYAPSVQEVLTSLGEKVQTKYKAGKK